MAISYPLSLPSVSGINSIQFRAENVTSMSTSPFTLESQVISHQGQRWNAMVKLPPMNRPEAEEWVAFMLSLKGQFGTFLMGDPLGASPRGSAGGTPLVDGASQTGAALNIDGASTSQTGWLKAGDYIQLGSGSTTSLHKVLQDVDTDGSGAATIEIWPNIRTAPADNATVTLSNAVGRFRMASPMHEWSISDVAVYGMTFAAVEAI